MKYKLKFEIIYSDKIEEIRNIKINSVMSDVLMEFDSQYPISNVPQEGKIVILGEKEYEVTSIKYKLDSEFYTIICYLIDPDSKKIFEKKWMEELINVL